MDESTRIKWIDYIRVFAILCVVSCHCIEWIYAPSMETYQKSSFLSNLFCFYAFSIGRLGVPLFLMVTGALLLCKEYDDKKAIHFWNKNCAHLFVCAVIWFLIYEIYAMINSHAFVTINQLVEKILFVRRARMSHSWYLPMIIGMYMLIPFIASIVNKYKNTTLVFPIVVLSIYAFCFTPFDTIMRSIQKNYGLELMFTMGSLPFAYILYIIFGHYIQQGFGKRIKTIILLLLTAFSLSLVVILQLWAYSKNYAYNVWYNNFLILVTATCIFELCSRMKKHLGYKAIKRISKYSFGIFLIHNILINYSFSFFNSIPVQKPLRVIIFSLFVYTCSLALSFVISRIPKVGNYLLYINHK